MMNGATGLRRPAFGDDDEARRVDAAGPMDAQNAPTRSLQNAQNAFRTASTRFILVIGANGTVTYVAGQFCYLGRRPVKLRTQNLEAKTRSALQALRVLLF